MVIKLDVKGQGAIEYLLLLGGAILVAALVLYLFSVLTPATTNKTNQKLDDFYNKVNQR